MTHITEEAKQRADEELLRSGGDMSWRRDYPILDVSSYTLARVIQEHSDVAFHIHEYTRHGAAVPPSISDKLKPLILPEPDPEPTAEEVLRTAFGADYYQRALASLEAAGYEIVRKDKT